MAQLPHTSQTAIAITFLVMNLSTLLRQFLGIFLCNTQHHAFFDRQLLIRVMLVGIINNKSSLLFKD